MHKFLLYLLVHWNICRSITPNENERKKKYFPHQDRLPHMNAKKKNLQPKEKKCETEKNVPVYFFSSLLSASKRTDENVLHIKWRNTLEWVWIKCILMQMTLYTKHFNNETQYHSIYHKHRTSYILTAKRSCAQRTSQTTQLSNIIIHYKLYLVGFFSGLPYASTML